MLILTFLCFFLNDDATIAAQFFVYISCLFHFFPNEDEASSDPFNDFSIDYNRRSANGQEPAIILDMGE